MDFYKNGNYSANMYGNRYNLIKPAAYLKSATLNSYIKIIS